MFVSVISQNTVQSSGEIFLISLGNSCILIKSLYTAYDEAVRLEVSPIVMFEVEFFLVFWNAHTLR